MNFLLRKQIWSGNIARRCAFPIFFFYSFIPFEEWHAWHFRINDHFVCAHAHPRKRSSTTWIFYEYAPRAASMSRLLHNLHFCCTFDNFLLCDTWPTSVNLNWFKTATQIMILRAICTNRNKSVKNVGPPEKCHLLLPKYSFLSLYRIPYSANELYVNHLD